MTESTTDIGRSRLTRYEPGVADSAMKHARQPAPAQHNPEEDAALTLSRYVRLAKRIADRLRHNALDGCRPLDNIEIGSYDPDRKARPTSH